MAPKTATTEPRLLASGHAIGESPRWHDGRLWFCHWGAGEIIALDPGGESEVMAKVPTHIPFSIDWLPDGRLLIVCGREGVLLRQEPDGSLEVHADLNKIAPPPWNEIVVDGRGNAYVNCTGFSFPYAEFAPGSIALVTPDGAIRQLADEIGFPNGMAVTPDNSTLIVGESFAKQLTAFDVAGDGGLSNRRVWAEMEDGPDGICTDAEGAVWAASMQRCVRIAEGGEVLQAIALDRTCFACMLGGADGATLFMLTAEWNGPRSMIGDEQTGQVLSVTAPVPAAGWP
jgi:sugar lactone lactonase YvrE